MHFRNISPSHLSIVDPKKVNAAWVGLIVERNIFRSGTQVILKNRSLYHLLKLQKRAVYQALWL